MAELDRVFGWTETTNAEVLQAWLMQALRQEYEPAWPALERFLIGVGRLKYLRPLYMRMAETPEGLDKAREIYARARPGYHSVSTKAIDKILEADPPRP